MGEIFDIAAAASVPLITIFVVLNCFEDVIEQQNVAMSNLCHSHATEVAHSTRNILRIALAKK